MLHQLSKTKKACAKATTSSLKNTKKTKTKRKVTTLKHKRGLSHYMW